MISFTGSKKYHSQSFFQMHCDYSQTNWIGYTEGIMVSGGSGFVVVEVCIPSIHGDTMMCMRSWSMYVSWSLLCLFFCSSSLPADEEWWMPRQLCVAVK